MSKNIKVPSIEDLLKDHPCIQAEIDKLHKQIMIQQEQMMVFGGILDPKRKVKKTKLGKILYNEEA